MSKDHDYIQQLLAGWEDTYKKGQLSFWILLSLSEQKRFSGEIQTFIKEATNATFSCENQSLYRALRKFYDAEIVDFELRQGQKGPERKHYFLTDIGQQLLKAFIERNILLFYSEKMKSILNIKSI